jgi:hypothetical protein
MLSNDSNFNVILMCINIQMVNPLFNSFLFVLSHPILASVNCDCSLTVDHLKKCLFLIGITQLTWYVTREDERNTSAPVWVSLCKLCPWWRGKRRKVEVKKTSIYVTNEVGKKKWKDKTLGVTPFSACWITTTLF